MVHVQSTKIPAYCTGTAPHALVIQAPTRCRVSVAILLQSARPVLSALQPRRAATQSVMHAAVLPRTLHQIDWSRLCWQCVHAAHLLRARCNPFASIIFSRSARICDFICRAHALATALLVIFEAFRVLRTPLAHVEVDRTISGELEHARRGGSGGTRRLSFFYAWRPEFAETLWGFCAVRISTSIFVWQYIKRQQ